MAGLTPWIGVGAIFLAGYFLATPQTLRLIGAENSRSGPPFYDSAANQPIRMIPSAFRAKWRNASPGAGGMKVTSKDAADISLFLRQAALDARVYAWRAATDRSDRIIVQPNSRKPTYVRTS